VASQQRRVSRMRVRKDGELVEREVYGPANLGDGLIDGTPSTARQFMGTRCLPTASSRLRLGRLLECLRWRSGRHSAVRG